MWLPEVDFPEVVVKAYELIKTNQRDLEWSNCGSRCYE
jgi:hypothetical protein